MRRPLFWWQRRIDVTYFEYKIFFRIRPLEWTKASSEASRPLPKRLIEITGVRSAFIVLGDAQLGLESEVDKQAIMERAVREIVEYRGWEAWTNFSRADRFVKFLSFLLRGKLPPLDLLYRRRVHIRCSPR